MPCADEGSWENQHADDRHDAFSELYGNLDGLGAVELRKAAKGLVKNYGKLKSGELRQAIKDTITAEQDGCWICHPELNEAQKTSKTRVSTTGERPSRKGQKINVPLRASGEAKAAVVVKAAPKAPIKVEREKYGTVRLDLTTPSFVLVLVWDEHGRYNYEGSVASVGGKTKKVRNVAEALRLLAEVGII